MMTSNELGIFKQLKDRLQQVLQASYPHFTRSLHDWKAQEITALQEDLHQKVKGYISEKWFYTHLKPFENDKLPRIDMLDMLARYVGYAGWQDFVFHTTPTPPEVVQKPIKIKTRQVPILIWVLVFLGISVLLAITFLPPEAKSIEFCFQDADTQKPIYQEVDVQVLQEKESPKRYKVQKNGCIQIKETYTKITLIVKAPYYKTDTIVRTIKQGQASEIIKLKKDDYALLIHLIAKHGTTAAEKAQRQKQLNHIFDAEAQIFQIDEAGLGIELYSKEEFIDKLSLPISSLKNIQIIETQYAQGKIILLRFLQL